jgi:hypothetical protein
LTLRDVSVGGLFRGINPASEKVVEFFCFWGGFYEGFVKKLSIYTHFSDFFMAVTCLGMRKIYICIEFG